MSGLEPASGPNMEQLLLGLWDESSTILEATGEPAIVGGVALGGVALGLKEE